LLFSTAWGNSAYNKIGAKTSFSPQQMLWKFCAESAAYGWSTSTLGKREPEIEIGEDLGVPL